MNNISEARFLQVRDTQWDTPKTLANHQNEMISYVIEKEYVTDRSDNKSSPIHSSSNDILKNVVINADVRDVFKIIPKECFRRNPSQ